VVVRVKRKYSRTERTTEMGGEGESLGWHSSEAMVNGVGALLLWRLVGSGTVAGCTGLRG